MVFKVCVSRVNEVHDYFLAAPLCMSISSLALELQTESRKPTFYD